MLAGPSNGDALPIPVTRTGDRSNVGIADGLVRLGVEKKEAWLVSFTAKEPDQKPPHIGTHHH